MKLRLDLEGEELLRRRLLGMEKALRGKVLLKAAKAGATLVRDRARELAPRGTGDLAERGIIFATTVRKATYIEVSVGHRRDQFYGVFQELGFERAEREFAGSITRGGEAATRGRPTLIPDILPGLISGPPSTRSSRTRSRRPHSSSGTRSFGRRRNDRARDP
jgi:hypothetical protein